MMTAFMKRSIVGGRQRYGYKFHRQKDGIYEISFIYAQKRSTKSKKLSEEAFPGYGSDGFTKWFCEKATVAKLVGAYAYVKGVPAPIGTSEEKKATCTDEKILLKVALKSL